MTFRTWLSSLRRNLTQRGRLERDLDDEVRGAFDLLVDEKLSAGLPPATARRDAAMELGGIEQVKEEIRVAKAGAWLDAFARDVRYAARMLVRSPGFAATAILTLALGIGANTTIFSFVYAVLLTPLPLEHLPRLVSVYVTDERNPGERGMSRQNYYDFRDRNEVLDAMTAEGWSSVSLAGGEGEPERVTAGVVTANYFSTLGVKPLVGRGFLPDEDRTEGDKLVTVLSYPLWQTRFGGERSIVGGTLTINNHAFTVVGVMPPEFKGTFLLSSATALWVPHMTYTVTTSGQTL